MKVLAYKRAMLHDLSTARTRLERSSPCTCRVAPEALRTTKHTSFAHLSVQTWLGRAGDRRRLEVLAQFLDVACSLKSARYTTLLNLHIACNRTIAGPSWTRDGVYDHHRQPGTITAEPYWTNLCNLHLQVQIAHEALARLTCSGVTNSGSCVQGLLVLAQVHVELVAAVLLRSHVKHPVRSLPITVYADSVSDPTENIAQAQQHTHMPLAGRGGAGWAGVCTLSEGLGGRGGGTCLT